MLALFLSTALADDAAVTTPDPTDPTAQTTALSGPALTWYVQKAEEKPACPAPAPVVKHHKRKHVVASTPVAPVSDPVLPVVKPDPIPPVPVTPAVTPATENDDSDLAVKFSEDWEELDHFGDNEKEEASEPPPAEREEPTFSPNRAQLGIGAMVVIAPPLPSAQAWAADQLNAFGRYEFGVSNGFSVGFEAMAGYGISADATSFRAAPVLAWDIGPRTGLTVGAGPSVLCERAFTAGPLCSVTRTGGFAEMGISVQAAGPVGLEFLLGGGYDVIESVKDGPGAIGNGYAGMRLFFGRVGTGETVE